MCRVLRFVRDDDQGKKMKIKGPRKIWIWVICPSITLKNWRISLVFTSHITFNQLLVEASWGKQVNENQVQTLWSKPGRNLGNKLPHHSWKYYPSLISLSLSLSLSSFVNIHYKWDTFLFLWTYITNVHLCLVSGLRVFNPFLLYFVISSCLWFEDLLSLEEFPANFST
jgi:hypothetical protein